MKRISLSCVIIITMGILSLWGGPVQDLMRMGEAAFLSGEYVKARDFYIDVMKLNTITSDQKEVAQHNINLCNMKIAEDNYNRNYSYAHNLYVKGQFSQSISMCNKLLSYSIHRSKTNNLIRICQDSLRAKIAHQHKTDSLQQINEQLRLEYQFWIDKATACYKNKMFQEARVLFECSLDNKFQGVVSQIIPDWINRCDSILEYKRAGGIIVTNQLAKAIASATYISDFSEGKAYVELKDSLGRKKSYIINTDGNVIFEGGSILDEFHDGYMAINGIGGDFINSEGEFMKADYMDGIYPYSVERFSEGLAPIKNKKNKWGYINKNMRVVISPKYDYVTSFSEGYALVRKGNKWAFIDNTGTEVIKHFNPGLGNTKYGFQHRNGNCYFSDGIAWIYDEDDIGINKNGERHIRANVWDNGSFRGLFIVREELFYWPHFASGLCPVGCYDTKSKVDKCLFGYMNKMGEVVVPQIYDKTYGFHEDRALVVKGSKYGYIDSTGKEIIPIQFPFESYNYTYNFSEGIVKIKNDDNLYGYMDNNGIMVIPFTFLEASSFCSGLAKVRSADIVTKGQYGYVDKFGNSTFDFQ